MAFFVYEGDARNSADETPCWGIQDSNGKIYPCIPCEQGQIEELVELLNQTEIEGEQLEEVIQDFEGYWIYKKFGNW